MVYLCLLTSGHEASIRLAGHELKGQLRHKIIKIIVFENEVKYVLCNNNADSNENYEILVYLNFSYEII